MATKALSLLGTKRFGPLFWTQFFGAFNDNLFKNALVMLITYRMESAEPGHAQMLVTLAGGLFILPYFLFSATAGQWADRMDRAKMARLVKIVEIVIMGIAVAGLLLNQIYFLLFVLFMLGVQATFFGPIKYALLPQHLAEDELVAGNGLIEAGTFLAILLGTIAGLLALTDIGLWIASATLMVVAGVGYVASRGIPSAPAAQPGLVLDRNIARATWNLVSQTRQPREIWLSILGISWFWLVGAVFLAQFPTMAKDVLHAEGSVVTLFLTVFSLGIGIGSALCNKLLRGRVAATYVPLGALGITLFTLDMVFTMRGVALPAEEALVGFWAFLGVWQHWHILFDLLGVSICAGLYIVPLYALLQARSDPTRTARVIASNNVMNALFMVASSLATLGMLSLGFSIPSVFLVMALANGVVAIWICRLLPDALVKSLLRGLLRLLYRVELRGIEHYPQKSERLMVVANHTSFLDALLIAAFLPERLTFAINTHIARAWWLKPMLSLVDTYPLDPTNPLAAKALVEAVRAGKRVMIFPEGRITVTGALMKVYEGPGMIADKAGAPLLPVRIDGAQYTPMSRMRGRVRLRWFPKVTLTVLPPIQFDLPEDARGRARRRMAAGKLYDVMAEMMLESSDYRRGLVEGLLDAMAVHGANRLIAEDVERHPISYRTLLQRAEAFGALLPPGKDAVGLLLPNAVGTLAAMVALLLRHRPIAMLNFSAGPAALAASAQAVPLRHIVTSRRFVGLAKLEAGIAALEKTGAAIHYTEDMLKRVNLLTKLGAALRAQFPSIVQALRGAVDPDSTAFILFTSGSEGLPKGVALSHTNLQANRYQLAARVDFGAQDIAFTCLPMFHAFGLTGGTLLPLLSGIRAFFYPSPLHYRIVPELIYDTNATILFGTDTFLSGYARFANAYDFHTLRYVFAGAEKLKDETRKLWQERFGIRPMEGYGSTECAPALAVNTLMQHRAGSVGRLLPGMVAEFDPVPGIEAAGEGRQGRLRVRGPNVMLGYLRSERPGQLEVPTDGWYDTGDVVREDAEGYLFILGRVKRFAKIGGEMVSLAAIEAVLSALWPEQPSAVASIPDAKKGEALVLVTERANARIEEFLPAMKAAGLTELAVPKKVLVAAKLPLLGTGKLDHNAIRQLALQMAAEVE